MNRWLPEELYKSTGMNFSYPKHNVKFGIIVLHPEFYTLKFEPVKILAFLVMMHQLSSRMIESRIIVAGSSSGSGYAFAFFPNTLTITYRRWFRRQCCMRRYRLYRSSRC